MNEMDIFIPEIKLEDQHFKSESESEDDLSVGDSSFKTMSDEEDPDYCEELQNFSKKCIRKDNNVQTKLTKYECKYSDCQSAFQRFDDLTRHHFYHTGVKSFVCSFENCNKAYLTVSHLNRHKKSHVAVNCKAKFCKASFVTLEEMHNHYKTNHKNVKTQVFACDSCEKVFKSDGGLLYHQKAHTEKYKFTCEKCNKGFNIKSHLTRHMKSHQDRICGECGKCFESYNALRTHLNEHKRIDNFKCDTCGLGFELQCRLVQHQQLHMPLTDRNVFKCDYSGCDRIYYNKRNLTAHVRVKHLKIVVFKCPVQDCEKEFATKQKLDYHTKVIHENPNPKPKIKKNIKNSGKYDGLRNQTRKKAEAIKLSNINLMDEDTVNSILLQDKGENVELEIDLSIGENSMESIEIIGD